MSPPLHVSGEPLLPGDKSITHRALLLAAAARGPSRLAGLLPSGDCRSTARVLRQLGCTIPELPADGAEIGVVGSGLDAWQEPAAVLDCGNSGTTARLLMGLLAGRPFAATLTGDASLRRRPMRRVTDPLEQMGAAVQELGEPDRLPLRMVGGTLRPLEHRSATASAQVKSAVLLAGLSGGVAVAVHEPARSRDHTERMLAALDVPVRATANDGGWSVRLDAFSAALPPLDLRVPADPSAAAFLVALTLLADGGELRLPGVCVNPTRAGFLDVVHRMGGRIDAENLRDQGGEPVADLVVRAGASLRATEIVGAEVPSLIDEIPILAVLAARAAGPTRITGAGELRVKESDRIAVTVAALRGLGIRAEELPDGFVVDGTDRPLRGRVRTDGDHRIAMAFGILGAQPGNRIAVDDPGAAEVSFPGFWSLLARLTASTARVR